MSNPFEVGYKTNKMENLPSYSGLPQDDWDSIPNYPKLIYKPRSPGLAKRSIQNRTYIVLLISFLIGTIIAMAVVIPMAILNNQNTSVGSDHLTENENPNENDHSLLGIFTDHSTTEDEDTNLSEENKNQTGSQINNNDKVEDSVLSDQSGVHETNFTTTHNHSLNNHSNHNSNGTYDDVSLNYNDEKEQDKNTTKTEDSPEVDSLLPTVAATNDSSNMQNLTEEHLNTANDTKQDNSSNSEEKPAKDEGLSQIIEEFYNENHGKNESENKESFKEWLNQIVNADMQSENFVLVGTIGLSLLIVVIMFSVGVTCIVMRRKRGKKRCIALKSVVTDLQSSEKIVLLDSESDED